MPIWAGAQVNEAVLAVEDLKAGYEPGAAIVRGVTLRVVAGEIVVVLGPNGAGKSTLIKAIAGLVPKFGGKVFLYGKEISKTKPHEVVRRGLGFVPQTENVFTLMSVADNLRLAADILPKAEKHRQVDAMYALFDDLARQRRLAAGRLSGGQRQMLAIARALIAKPSILMLDEATAGLSPKLVGQLFAKVVEIRNAGVTILMVEQNAKAALAVADRACIMSEGLVVHEGSAADIARDPLMGRLYFGVKAPESAA
jgi:branched-chain amino acid transport system ATP-binding protein